MLWRTRIGLCGSTQLARTWACTLLLVCACGSDGAQPDERDGGDERVGDDAGTPARDDQADAAQASAGGGTRSDAGRVADGEAGAASRDAGSTMDERDAAYLHDFLLRFLESAEVMNDQTVDVSFHTRVIEPDCTIEPILLSATRDAERAIVGVAALSFAGGRRWPHPKLLETIAEQLFVA